MSERNGYADFGKFQAAAKSPPRYTEVDIYGVGRVRLKSIDAAQFARVQNAARESGAKGLRDSYAVLVSYCVVDGEGNQVFEPSQDAKLLNSLDSVISQQLTEACMAHCGIVETDLEELAKNSPATSTENMDSD